MLTAEIVEEVRRTLSADFRNAPFYRTYNPHPMVLVMLTFHRPGMSRKRYRKARRMAMKRALADFRP